MSDLRYKIRFSGELMPEMQIDEVKQRLARLFKSDISRIEALFKGPPIILKNDLSLQEAERYLSILQQVGAKAHKEIDLSSGLALVEEEDEPIEVKMMTCPKCGHQQPEDITCSACDIVIEKYLLHQEQIGGEKYSPEIVSTKADSAFAQPQDDEPVNPLFSDQHDHLLKETDPATSLSLVEEENEPVEVKMMTCPKCGHRQPENIACSACDIVIEKYLARQAEMEEAGAAMPGSSTSPYASPRANIINSQQEFSELKPFGIQGRIGRIRYLGWSVALTLCTIPVVAALQVIPETLGALLLAILGFGMLVVGIFFGVQRLHDIGWSGWLLLLNLVPVVGMVMALLMLVVPGNTGSNRYGPPPPPNSTAVTILACLFLLMPVVGIIAAIAIPSYQGYVEQEQMRQQLLEEDN